MSKRDKLEPLADGWVAFHTESGDRWKHKDFTENAPTGTTAHYRSFVSDKGEQKRYTFAPKDARDSPFWDCASSCGDPSPSPAPARGERRRCRIVRSCSPRTAPAPPASLPSS
jgi:hypothetical protein